MSEFVCPNTFCTFAPTLRTINQGEYILLERSLHRESKDFTSRAIGAARKKNYCGRGLKCDVVYQPLLKMLLLHLWKELLQM